MFSEGGVILLGKRIKFAELSVENLLFTELEPVRQRFPDGSIWSGYINTPRPSNALIYACSDVTLVYEAPGMETIELHRDQVLFAPKGSCYKVTSRNPSQHSGADSYTVNFNIFDREGNEVTVAQPLAVIARDRFSRFHALVAELTRACYDVRPSRLKSQAAFLTFLDAVLESAEECSREYYVIRRGVEELTRDWNRQEKMSKYAEICGISQCYFNAMFRAWSGMGPVEYRNRLRITHAQAILRSGSVGVSETAVLVGFEDPFYFSRVFKSITGVSPQEYKRDHDLL